MTFALKKKFPINQPTPPHPPGKKNHLSSSHQLCELKLLLRVFIIISCLISRMPTAFVHIFQPKSLLTGSTACMHWTLRAQSVHHLRSRYVHSLMTFQSLTWWQILTPSPPGLVLVATCMHHPWRNTFPWNLWQHSCHAKQKFSFPDPHCVVEQQQVLIPYEPVLSWPLLHSEVRMSSLELLKKRDEILTPGNADRRVRCRKRTDKRCHSKWRKSCGTTRLTTIGLHLSECRHRLV